MPLPSNGTFPLLGYSKPGEVAPSKPKQAMVIRMSPETLDALQSTDPPPMEFQFGDNPGIHIGKNFFPMNAASTERYHEIFLRSTSATKKSPPFKLYANVVGKYTVQRQLERVEEQVRERRNEAENERASRTTIMLDAPPAPAQIQAKQKKKKDQPTATTSIFRKPVTSSSKPAEPSAVIKLSPERKSDLRKRLIHFLASEDGAESMADKIVKAVGGRSLNDRSKQLVLQELEEVADLVSKSNNTYRLKLQLWTEVRPYNWPNWSETQTSRVCAEARKKLKELGIPTSDPLWSHFTFPSASNSSEPAGKKPMPTASTAVSQPSGLRKQTEREGGDLKKRRTDANIDIKERQQPSSKVNIKSETPNANDNRRSASAAIKNQDRSRDSPRPNVASSSNASPYRPPRTKLSRPLDEVRGSSSSGRKMGDAISTRESSASSAAKQISRPTQRPGPRGDESNAESELDRRPRQRPERDPVTRVSRHEREDGEYSDSSVSLKRKATGRDREYDMDARHSPVPQKRRKTESNSSSLKPKQEDIDRSRLLPSSRDRDSSNFSTQPRSVKREPSPPAKDRYRPSSPLPRKPIANTEKPSKATSSLAGHSSSSKNGKSSGAKRRRSPIYTSSEEEELPKVGASKSRPHPTAPSFPKSAAASAPPLPPHSVSSAQSSSSSSSNPPPVPSHLRPTKSLRSKYYNLYPTYTDTLKVISVQRARIDERLRKCDNSTSDSDEATDMLSPEAIIELAATYQNQHNELVLVQQAHANAASDGTAGSSE